MRLTVGNANKKILCLILCLWLPILMCSSNAGGEDPPCHDLVVTTDSGAVNWTKGVLTAVGVGAPPDAHYQNQQGKTLALRMAVEDAQQKLLSVAQSLQIDNETTVAAFAQEHQAVLTEIKEMVKQAEVVHQEYSTDGSVAVTVQMNINGGFSQLVLPPKIKQIESIKPISNHRMDQASKVADQGLNQKNQTTGLIVDARELSFTPCLVPQIVDEFGHEVFGPAFASREFAVQRNMSGYTLDMAAAAANERVAPRPLIVKGLKAEGKTRTQIVVSHTDAAKLKHDVESLAFLRQCCVIIVADSKGTGNAATPPDILTK